MVVAISIVHITALVLLIWELYYVAKQEPSTIQIHLIMVLVSTIIMLIGYEVEITATNMEAAYVGQCAVILATPYALLFTTLFIMKYCGETLSSLLSLVTAFVNIIFPALAIANDYHHMFYEAVSFNPDAEFSGLVLEAGVLYPVYVAAMLAYVLCDIGFIIIAFKKAQTRREFVKITYFCGIIAMIVVGAGLPMLGILKGYDTTAIGFVLGALFLYLMFTRNQIFDVIAMAKSVAVEESRGGIAVINRENKIEYKNAFISQLLEDEVFTVDELVRLRNGDSVVERGIYAYSVRKKPIKAYEDGIGYIIEIVDFTDSYNYARKLEKEVAERVDTLRHVQRGVIAGFTNIVEARDSNTGDHIKNTENYVRMICDGLMEIGWYENVLTKEYADFICDAAPMHDIGKISVSDSILLKPGKLTSEEFEMMKAHTISGRDVIESTMRGIESDEYVDIAKEIAMYHHEKWDGTGYPERLSGENIPLPARIMAVADVYDALVTRRVYKDEFSFEKAVQIIKDGQGTHFDPVIVEVFLYNLFKSKGMTMSDLQALDAQ